MVLTDTHTHLYSDKFDDDRDLVIRNAIDKGIERFFVPAIDSTHTGAMLQLEETYPGKVFLMTGLHPTSVAENYKTELEHVEGLLARRKFFAIGEIGIDLYWDRSFLKEQEEAFKHQIRLAKKYKLPIVIHSRDSFDEIFAVLEEEKGPDLFGIFHCFTGTFEQAERAIGYQMKLGIGGVVTFKNGKIDTFLGQIPLEHIVLETDSPYLAPVPFRGKRNESGYLVYILNKLSEIYGVDTAHIAAVTTANSRDVFGV